jgi:uncharacterized membrane protein YccC
MFPKWIYIAVAALIALAAFGIGQAFPGMGVPFVALASTFWVAYCVYRQSRFRRRDC